VSEITAERYLRLGLRLGRHVEGIVDAYYGPPELAAAVDTEPPVDPRMLVAEADALLEELEDGWLRDQVVGVRTYAGVLAGEPRSYADEVEGCYGVRPTHTEEAVFTAAHEQLEKLLPGDGTLAERHARWEGSSLVPADRAKGLIAAVIEEARAWTGRLVELPDGEDVVLEMMHDKPWWASCDYLGDLSSRIRVNVDLPLSAVELLILALHETYPGHHTERCCKEHLLVRGRGLLEETLVLTPTPQSLVTEGIGKLGPELLLEGRGRDGARRDPARRGIRPRSRPRARRQAGARAVPLGGGERGTDVARRRGERGRGAALSRALGSTDARVVRPHVAFLHRADFAHLRHHVSRRGRPMPLVRDGRAASVPPPADRAGAGPRPPGGERRMTPAGKHRWP
jgi:hypothetical protein